MNRLQRAIAAWQGRVIIPDTHVLLPAPTASNMGWVMITTAELETVVMVRAKFKYLKRTGNKRIQQFPQSEEFRNARAALRDAINGTDPKNG